jgi:uncharacterized protein (DUF433 family)
MNGLKSACFAPSGPERTRRKKALFACPYFFHLNYKERVVLDPHVHFGKPCIAGTRIPVEDVLELIQEGISFERITEEFYPDLALEDIKACAWYTRSSR